MVTHSKLIQKESFGWNGVSDLTHLRVKSVVIRNKSKERICNELNIDMDSDIGDVFDKF